MGGDCYVRGDGAEPIGSRTRSIGFCWVMPVVPHKAVAEVSKIGNL